MMTALGPQLEKLGLIEYGDKFVSEGFDTWESLCDITESDLNELSVKLGHRRKLQRAITDYHSRAKTAPLRINHGKRPSQEANNMQEASEVPSGPVMEEGPRQKRKYRRHPKPDENAPERPASAYVIFSNYMREQLKGQDLSFTDMAKLVGERWQVLSADSREVYEKRAAATKEKYNLDLADYKKTKSYSTYVEYLADFKAKNVPQDNEPTVTKRIKLAAGESTGSNNSYDSHDSRTSRRKSAIFTPPAVSAESTQDSRISSRSNSYASDGQSPGAIKENKYSSTRSPILAKTTRQQHAYSTTMSRDDTPSTHHHSVAQYAAPSHSAKSSSGNGVYRTHELPFSLTRPMTSTSHGANQDSPASSVSSLPPIAAALQYDAHLYGKSAYAPHQNRAAHDYGTSPHTPFHKIVDADGPRSIRTLPTPEFRRPSNATYLPPILPSFDGSRATSNLDTLLLAAKVAEKHDMPASS